MRTGTTRRSVLVGGLSAAHLLGGNRLGFAQEKAQSCPAGSWTTLPPTPSLPAPRETGHIRSGSAKLWFAEFGDPHFPDDPIILLHGGLANSDYWGNIVPLLISTRRVIVLDTRGHGRSILGSQRLTYSLLASDVIRLLDYRSVERAAIVGWSDGGIAGLLLAMTYPNRVSRLFASGANFDASGAVPGGDRTSTFSAFVQRSRNEYRQLSPDPAHFDQLRGSLGLMWKTEPRFSTADLARISTATTIADGEFDEIIARRHTSALAASIPGSHLLIQPCVSHFALIQDPALFARDVLASL